MAISTYDRDPLDPTIVRAAALAGGFRRISWGAIIAGVILALVTQLVLGMLGLGIGMSTVDPAAGETPDASTIGIGAAVWWVLTTLIALFIGGWVAGRLAGIPRRLDGVLHGLVTFGATTLIMAWLLTTTVGAMIGGTMSVLGNILSGAGQVAAAAAPRVAGAVSEGLERRDIGWDDVRRELLTLLRQTGKPELQPEEQAEAALDTARDTGPEAAGAPSMADEEAQSLLDRVLRQAQSTTAAADREALVNVLVNRTGMTREEAERTVQNWQNQYQQAQARVAATARGTADQAAGVVTQAALWGFVALVLAAVAAAIGGAVGRPREALPVVQA
jgi:polyhydroxyalkanoate synthesis regulator phasin